MATPVPGILCANMYVCVDGVTVPAAGEDIEVDGIGGGVGEGWRGWDCVA